MFWYLQLKIVKKFIRTIFIKVIYNAPVALQNPTGSHSDEDIVSRHVDQRFWQQPRLERTTEHVDLLIVEEQGTVEALDAEKVPTPGTAERPDRQRGRESLQLVLVGHL